MQPPAKWLFPVCCGGALCMCDMNHAHVKVATIEDCVTRADPQLLVSNIVMLNPKGSASCSQEQTDPCNQQVQMLEAILDKVTNVEATVEQMLCGLEDGHSHFPAVPAWGAKPHRDNQGRMKLEGGSGQRKQFNTTSGTALATGQADLPGLKEQQAKAVLQHDNQDKTLQQQHMLAQKTVKSFYASLLRKVHEMVPPNTIKYSAMLVNDPYQQCTPDETQDNMFSMSSATSLAPPQMLHTDIVPDCSKAEPSSSRTTSSSSWSTLTACQLAMQQSCPEGGVAVLALQDDTSVLVSCHNARLMASGYVS
ncbi:hypothetical protein V8C86DRAFT_3036221 [Haematococcus lacustris]